MRSDVRIVALMLVVVLCVLTLDVKVLSGGGVEGSEGINFLLKAIR